MCWTWEFLTLLSVAMEDSEFLVWLLEFYVTFGLCSSKLSFLNDGLCLRLLRIPTGRTTNSRDAVPN